MAKISVNDFKKLIREQVGGVASERSWDINKEAERGYAFQFWLAKVISAYEVGFDALEPDDVCLLSNDLVADLVFDDPDHQHLLICQAKYQGFDKSVEEAKVRDFFSRHERFLDREWVLKHGSEQAAELLGDYREKIEGGYSITYYFVSTGTASERVREAAGAATNAFAAQGVNVRCELFDFEGLKDYYSRSLSVEESSPSEVRLQLPSKRFFEQPGPHPTVVAVLKGNELRALYKRYKEALYTWNIRGYLGNRGINKKIFETAEHTPEKFFYFNNGVSAICTDYTFESPNELVAQNFQIINGAQTISTLSKAKANSAIDVLFRLTKAESVKTDKGFNRDIIQFNNTQNLIKVSDFRANDEIQLWLEWKFKSLKPTSVVPAMSYQRKRAPGRRAGATVIRPEELAKIRFAFNVEPTLPHSSPKSLWTPAEESGSYDQAFGVDGELQAEWSEETFEETVAAAAIYLRICQVTKELGAKKPELRFLRRLRFHALALAGAVLRWRSDEFDIHKLLHSKPAFEQFWKVFWEPASWGLIDLYQNAMQQRMTMFALVRSEERWRQLEAGLRLKIDAASPV